VKRSSETIAAARYVNVALMPELPEVETVVRGLRLVLPGRSIVAVRLGKTDFIDDPATLGELLPGNRITNVERIGKFIHLQLAPDAGLQHREAETKLSGGSSANPGARLNLIVHLGMTGRLGVREASEPAPPHTHGFFELDDGRELRYTDIRRFGRILLMPDARMEEFRSRLGDDALNISAADFHRRLAGRRARIKALLLDQRVFRGIGNIYADESLWQARIHPARLAARLSNSQLARLRQAIHRVLRTAIRHRGSSISDFVDAEGNRGRYQQQHHAYDREGQPCSRCGRSIRRAIVAGRSSYFCPHCQPAPRSESARAKKSHKSPRRRDLMKSGQKSRRKSKARARGAI
jgi:formamidopyrimidine-DNA glycosylase